jgi:hypothetical protein
MSNAALTLHEISPDGWNVLLDTITKEYRGAHAQLQVVGADIGAQIETGDRPFQGISADVKDRESIVWIHFAGLEHGVHGVAALRMVPRVGDAAMAIEIEDKGGVKTILTLSDPEAYELPPAE